MCATFSPLEQGAQTSVSVTIDTVKLRTKISDLSLARINNVVLDFDFSLTRIFYANFLLIIQNCLNSVPSMRSPCFSLRMEKTGMVSRFEQDNS